jgi:hypothetical protein
LRLSDVPGEGSNQSSRNPIKALHAQIPPNLPGSSTVNDTFQAVVPDHLQINTKAGPLSEAEKTWNVQSGMSRSVFTLS